MCKNGRKIEVGEQGAESLERRAWGVERKRPLKNVTFFVIPAAGIHNSLKILVLYIPPLKGVRGISTQISIFLTPEVVVAKFTIDN